MIPVALHPVPFMALPLAALLLLPGTLDAHQDPVRLGGSLDLAADRGRHADHAHLHRLQPIDAAIEIIALERIRPLDRDADALCQVAQLALTAGLLSQDVDDRLAWFRRGEEYARTARNLRPVDPDPMFAQAAAIGLKARHQPIRERIRSAKQVLALSDSILALEPDHPGGLHLRGKLTAEAMALNTVVRFMVERIFGGDVVAEASWAKAESYFRQAIASDPENPAHRIELALVLHHTGRTDEARAQLRRAIKAPGGDARRELYRQRAADVLDEIDAR